MEPEPNNTIFKSPCSLDTITSPVGNPNWVQRNLKAEADSRFELMMKLIVVEELDSFKGRAEAFYKNRPELVKLLQEFHQAYRALIEDIKTQSQENRRCLEKISGMEIYISQVDKEAQLSRHELNQVTPNKGVVFAPYGGVLMKIANWENKLALAEEGGTSAAEERANRAEKEVETLNQIVARRSDEKERLLLQKEDLSATILDMQSTSHKLFEKEKEKILEELRSLDEQILSMEKKMHQVVARLQEENELLLLQKEDLNATILNMQAIYHKLVEKEKGKLLEDMRSLEEEIVCTEKEIQKVKFESSCLSSVEALSKDHINNLHIQNVAPHKKLQITEGKLDRVKEKEMMVKAEEGAFSTKEGPIKSSLIKMLHCSQNQVSETSSKLEVTARKVKHRTHQRIRQEQQQQSKSHHHGGILLSSSPHSPSLEPIEEEQQPKNSITLTLQKSEGSSFQVQHELQTVKEYNRFLNPLDVQMKKEILERLASDGEKLTHLHKIVIEHLVPKVESAERICSGRKLHWFLKSIGVNEQVGEAEKSIKKFHKDNGRLQNSLKSPSPMSFEKMAS